MDHVDVPARVLAAVERRPSVVNKPLRGELVGPDAGPRAEVSAETTSALHVRLAGEWPLSFDSVHIREA